MIAIDFSGTIIANIMGAIFADPNKHMDENLIRHNVLNSIRKYNVKFRNYGRIVIACDGNNYWRHEIFPYYKVKRKEARKADNYDWQAIFKYIDKIKKEIKEHLPYPVIEVARAEADDIIAILTDNTEKHIIVSRDKDLRQLQKNSTIKQWNPVDDRWEICNDPAGFLLEHIICGDTGDSIPNIFSPENSFAIGLRQKPATKKKIGEIFESDTLPPELLHRFNLNEQLIDLTKIPNDVKEDIIKEFDSQLNKPKKRLMDYFMVHGLNSHASNIQDFA